MTHTDNAASLRTRGALLALTGLGLAHLGVAAYVVQISLQRLMAPWYMPILASFGVVLVIISLLERRTVWRALALLAVVVIACAGWAFLYGGRLPRYAGPIVVGRPFPAFETKRADGKPFAERDLAGENNNVLVFFRGRW
jgi:hypothetical protein